MQPFHKKSVGHDDNSLGFLGFTKNRFQPVSKTPSPHGPLAEFPHYQAPSGQQSYQIIEIETNFQPENEINYLNQPIPATLVEPNLAHLESISRKNSEHDLLQIAAPPPQVSRSPSPFEPPNRLRPRSMSLQPAVISFSSQSDKYSRTSQGTPQGGRAAVVTRKGVRLKPQEEVDEEDATYEDEEVPFKKSNFSSMKSRNTPRPESRVSFSARKDSNVTGYSFQKSNSFSKLRRQSWSSRRPSLLKMKRSNTGGSEGAYSNVMPDSPSKVVGYVPTGGFYLLFFSNFLFFLCSNNICDVSFSFQSCGICSNRSVLFLFIAHNLRKLPYL